jgi:hypothetical protein
MEHAATDAGETVDFSNRRLVLREGITVAG